MKNFQVLQVDRKNKRVRRNFRVTRRGRMMASKASHTTTKKTATPAANSPGYGITLVIHLVGAATETARSGFQARVNGNFRFEELRDRAARLRGFHRGIKLGFICSGYARDQVEMALRDAEAVADLFQAYGSSGLQLLCRQTGATELRRKRHGETSGMRRGKKFFRVGAHTVLEARAERILCLLQDAAIRGYGAFAGLEIALPDGACFTLHKISPGIS